jgi:hypothetical protein
MFTPAALIITALIALALLGLTAIFLYLFFATRS